MDILKKYQKDIVEKAYALGRAAIFLNMGMGKTIISLALMEKKLKEGGRALVISPKQAGINTWPSEIKKFSENLFFTRNPRQFITSLNLRTKLALESTLSLVDIVNPDNLVWLLNQKEIIKNYRCIIVDESSLFKDSRTKRFKVFVKIKEYILKNSNDLNIYLLSGIPAPNDISDVWSQIYMLDEGKRLEINKTRFLLKYAYRINTYQWAISKENREDIYKIIKNICIYINPDLQNKEGIIETTNLYIDLGSELLKKYKDLKKNLLIKIDDKIIISPIALVLATKLLQFTSGNIYSTEKEVCHVHNKKIDVLEEIITLNYTTNFIVVYQYAFEANIILNKFPNALTSNEENWVNKWNDGNFRVLILNVKSCSHGLNLQFGGHVMIWFTLTWSLDQYKQTVARINRHGQDRKCLIYHLICKDTIDEIILLAIKSKENNLQYLLKYLAQKD